MKTSLSICILLLTIFCNYAFPDTEIDISKYDKMQDQITKNVMIGDDYANIGNYKKAAEYLEKAVENGKLNSLSVADMNKIRLKLSVVYIQLGESDKAQSVLKEITGRDIP